MSDSFLRVTDATRVCCVLDKLQKFGLRTFAITGSIALELQLCARGQTANTRVLNDLDIVVESFTSVPSALTNQFLAHHVHPHAPEGKMVVQLVDPDQTLRVDIFRAYGLTLARSQSFDFAGKTIQMVSVEDLAARTASLLMDLARGSTVARKHAQDFERLSNAVNFDDMATVWREHRKPTDPLSFEAAVRRISGLVASRNHLLIVPEYLQDVEAVCPKCSSNGVFPLASANRIKAILGYC